MMLTGYSPIEIIVSSNGNQLMSDWLFCYHLVDKEIRPGNSLKKITKDNSTLQYSRIRGEWLANFTYLYFRKHWQGGLLRIYKEYFNEKQIRPDEKEYDIRRAETQIISKYIAKRINSLI